MGAPNVNTHSNDYSLGRGRLFFNRLTDGIYEGFRYLGNCPAFDFTVETENYVHYSSEGGVKEEDLNVPLQTTRTSNITCDNLSNENLALFFSGTVGSVVQSSTPVTDYAIANVTANRTYLIGASSSVPTGVRNISSIAVRVKNGDDASARANSTAYAVGDVYVPATPNSHWYICSVAGTSAGSPPTFTTDGTTFADGTATFKDMGLIVVASTANVNYRIDTDLGLLSVTPAGTIATAIAAIPATVLSALPTYGISLHVDYTPAANSRVQISTGNAGKLEGQLMFIADNPYGANKDALLPSITLAPSGSIPFIAQDEVGSMQLAVGVNKLNTDTASVYIDGRPA